MVIVTVKDTILVKTSFMHYRNYITWTRVKLPVVFAEFYMVYVFWLLFSFYYYCQLVQGQLEPKSGGGGGGGPAAKEQIGDNSRNN